MRGDLEMTIERENEQKNQKLFLKHKHAIVSLIGRLLAICLFWLFSGLLLGFILAAMWSNPFSLLLLAALCVWVGAVFRVWKFTATHWFWTFMDQARELIKAIERG